MDADVVPLLYFAFSGYQRVESILISLLTICISFMNVFSNHEDVVVIKNKECFTVERLVFSLNLYWIIDVKCLVLNKKINSFHCLYEEAN